MKAGAQHEGLSGRCAVTTAALLFSSSKAFPKSLAMSLVTGSEAYVCFRSGDRILKGCGRVAAVEGDTVVICGYVSRLGSLTEAVRGVGPGEGEPELCFVRVQKQSVVTQRPAGWPREKVPSKEDSLSGWAAVNRETEISSGAEAPKEKHWVPKKKGTSLQRDLSALGELWEEEEEEESDSDDEGDEEAAPSHRPPRGKHLPPGSSGLQKKAKAEKEKAPDLGESFSQMVQQGLSEGQSPSELMPLMMMSLLAQQQTKSKKKSKGSKDWDLLGGSSSDESSDERGKRDSGMRAVATLHRLHRRTLRHPRRVIQDFEHEVTTELGVIPGQSWTLKDYLRKQHWGKFKGIYRCAVMDAAAYELLRSGQVEAGTAQLVQNMKAKMQSVIQNGDWSSAWLLTGIADPLSKKEFGGTKEELAVVSGYVNALQKIRKQVKEAQAAGHGKGEEED